jgi:hypothetical protein
VNFIEFQDPEVLRVLLANGVGDGNGITEEQAAAVTSIGTWFKGNTAIQLFDEFEKFTGVTVVSGSYTNISSGAFANATKLKQVKIPKSVSDINAATFMGCSSLTGVGSLENVVKIGSRAFHTCSNLEIDLYLPNVTEILDSAFLSSGILSITSLGKIKKISGATNTTSSGTFNGCKNLTYVNIPDSVTEIGGCAFYNCTSLEIEDLNIPNLETLGQNAFYGVKIKKISNLGKITALPSASTPTQNFGDKSVLEEVVLPEGLTTIPGYSFSEYTKLSKITIPKSVTTIGNYAFNRVPIGGDIDLPNLTGSIGNYAFSRTNIERIINLGQITKLSNSSNETAAAFGQCDNLKLVTLPETLETIGGYIFYKCTSLEVVVCHAITPPTLDSTSFNRTNSTFVIYVPDASVTAYREASGWSAYADRIKPLSEYTE